MDTQIDILHKNVLESMPHGVLQVDLKGVIVYANNAAFKLLNIDNRSNLIGTHYSSFEVARYEDGESFTDQEHALYTVLTKKKPVTSSLQGIIIDDKLKWLSVDATLLFDENKEPIGAICNLADITEKIIKDEQQKHEEGRYKILVENLNAVVWETKIGTQTFSYISPKASELLGFPIKKWLEEGFWQSRIYKEDRERVVGYERHKAPDTNSYQLEYRLVHKNGDIKWVQDMVEVVKVGGKPELLRGLMLDITDKKNSRLKLRESESRYRQMINEAPYAITIYDREGTLVAANSKSEKYWLINLDEYIGKFNIFNNELFIKNSQVDEIKKAFDGEMGEIIAEIPLTHADSSKTYRIKYYPLFDTEGQLDNVVYFTEDITNYQEADKKIKREESLKQGVLDALDEAILVVDEHGIILSVNRNLRLYIKNQPYAGLQIGKSVFGFMDFFGEGEYLKKGLKSILDQKTKSLDHEMKLADGKWYNLRATRLNEPFGAVISLQNINTRKEIEMALEKSLKKYRSIYNKAPVMMHSINERLEIISVSDFWLDKMGYERNEVIGKSPYDFMVEEKGGVVQSNLDKLFNDGFIRNIEYRYVKKSGEIMNVLLSAVAEYDEEGNFERSITGMLDVTDLKAAETRLQDSQAKLLEAQRISKIANYEYDVVSGSFTPSEEMIAMMGFSDSQRHVSVIEQLIHPDDLAEFKEKLNKCINEGKDFFHFYRIHHLKSGKIKWISGRGKMIKDVKDNVIRMIGTIQDISEQKQAEQKIRRLSDRILLATEIANLGVWEYDRETDEIFWEDQMYSIFTMVDSPVPIKKLESYLVDDDKTIVERSLKLVKQGINFLESDFRVKIEAEEKYLRAFTRIIRDRNGKIKGMVGVIYDITADKRLQMRLESSLEEKNILIKEVHHRVKNNMQLISSILALKSYDLDDDKSKAIFNEVNDRIKAMSVIHDKLYTFNNVSEINIGEYLQHIAQELQILQGSSSISIEVESEKIILDVEKALLIGLMVSEMVGNALKHGFKVGQQGKISILFSKEPGHFLLRVLNDGEKMQEQLLESSTGLGVSLVKTFVKQLGGKVEVDSENGLRASF
ncbi:PAS domain S-box protein [Ekhidna sp.]|uniref:PAS domain-containing sensor histidine kinase n=1 Tax=Ekhidna sp. TaxID=2608089 RepID=UPI0032988398